MNYTIENKSSKRNGVRKNNHYHTSGSVSCKGKNMGLSERRLKDGGFIAWPENEVPVKEKDADCEIIEGRSKKGGFIAFPKI